MAVGVFGKLPARRDYVQNRVDPALMKLLDPWLQSAVAESRQTLGDGWLDAYLSAPIWRFWLGPGIAGRPALGALMPSVDGVGRYFPLCVIGTYETPVPPPEVDAQPAWFAAVEELMLAALAEGGTYEALVEGLRALPPAGATATPAGDRGDVGAAFAALRRERIGDFYERFTCWWLPPVGGTTPPRALLRHGLPSPAEYAGMMRPGAGVLPAPALGGA